MSRSILLVEDDESIRKPLALFLAQEGYSVITAGNGNDALDWLHKNSPPALILLDLMMPVMNGAEFLSRRRRDPMLCTVPVVVLTAWQHRWQDVADVQGILPKPIDTAKLLAVTARYCERSVTA